MEPISAISLVAQMTEQFYSASQFLRTSSSATPEVDKLIKEYSMCIEMLSRSMEMVQTVPESSLTQTVLKAAADSASLAQKLVHRQQQASSSSARRIYFALASVDRLRDSIREFREGVKHVHTLAQDIMLQQLVREQARLLVHAETQRAFNEVVKERLASRGSGIFRKPPLDAASTYSAATSFTVGNESLADAVTLADEIVSRSTTRGIQFDNDVTLIIGTITVVHEDKPRFVPVRAKYDTGSDVNFIPSSFVESHGLGDLLQELTDDEKEDNVFLGLNDQEYRVTHTITLQWCASGMHHIRTTQFHVADEVPFDMLLGNPFIQENRIFDPHRTALALRRKRKNPAQRAEEQRKAWEHEDDAAQEHQSTRNEDARRRALEKEARRLAKSQTSASSMISGASSQQGTLNRAFPAGSSTTSLASASSDRARAANPSPVYTDMASSTGPGAEASDEQDVTK